MLSREQLAELRRLRGEGFESVLDLEFYRQRLMAHALDLFELAEEALEAREKSKDLPSGTANVL